MNTRCNTLMMGAALIGLSSAHAVAQETVTVVPGSHYAASATREWLFGAGYRALWQTPVSVPVLNLATYARGLVPVKEGGGRQTRTLHLRARNGREYVFRSVDKDAARSVPAEVSAFDVGNIIQDMIALFNPAGPPMVAPLLEAVSVLHASPRLYLMADDTLLGEHQTTFGGMLGYLEERPEEGADSTSGFAGSRKIVSTEKIQELLREDARNRVEERDWLAARLIDFVVGDTDRGSNQWRWARFSEGEMFRWRPIPRDRDFAFIHADGVMPTAASLAFKRFARYREELPRLEVLIFSARHHDRTFLQSLDAAAFAAITRDVQQQLSDAVIENAVSAMPPEHYALIGPSLADRLRARRNALTAMSREFYDDLAVFVDVQGSDQNELAEIHRRADGGVEVRLYRGAPDQVAMRSGQVVARTRRPFYQRDFIPSETKEVRIYLHGGDDRVVVSGPHTLEAINVRIIAGDGDDDLIDSSTDGAGRTHTWFYDDDDKGGTISRGRHTDVDRKAFIEPSRPVIPGLTGDKARYRDWGEVSVIAPALDFRANTGFIMGVQFGERAYGFRRVPFEAEWRGKLLFAPGSGAFGAELEAVEYFENSEWSVGGEMRASGYDDLQFSGYGNDTPDIDSDSSLVELTRIEASGSLRYTRHDTHFAVGVSMELLDTPIEDGTPLAAVQPLGTNEWTQYGVWTKLETTISRHASVVLGGAVYPAAASVREAYAKGRGEAVVHMGSAPVLALRAIGEKIWGDAPFQHAAFVGGRKLLRGYSSYRFAGDAALAGNAELRIPVIGKRAGVFLLGDAGRVYVDGESPGGWHTAYGAGVSLSAAGKQINATYANGEDHKFYITLGHGF